MNKYLTRTQTRSSLGNQMLGEISEFENKLTETQEVMKIKGKLWWICLDEWLVMQWQGLI